MERVSNFPNEGEVTVLTGEPQAGDVVRKPAAGKYDYFRYYPDVTPTPQPDILSKTAFMDHAVAQFMSVNSSTQSEAFARFTEVMEAAKTSTDAAVRFAYARYEAEDTFEKTNTENLTALMVADSTTGHLTANERNAVVNNWPT